MKRSAPIKRKTPLRRKKTMNRVSKRYRARMRAEAADPFLNYVRGLRCVVRGCLARRCDAAHVRSRGAGGGDEGNRVPICRDHHTLRGDSFHVIGRHSFEDRHGLDLDSIAAEIARSYSP